MMIRDSGLLFAPPCTLMQSQIPYGGWNAIFPHFVAVHEHEHSPVCPLCLQCLRRLTVMCNSQCLVNFDDNQLALWQFVD